MKHQYINDVEEIIDFLCVDEKEANIIRKRYKEGDVLVIKFHKNSFGYSWE